MRFGGQTISVVTVVENTADRDRYGKPALVRTEVPVTGCHFRPLSAKETIALGDIVTDPWKLTAPPVAAILGLQPADEIKHGGITYQVVGGVRPHNDFSDHVFKCTVICERRPS